MPTNARINQKAIAEDMLAIHTHAETIIQILLKSRKSKTRREKDVAAELAILYAGSIAGLVKKRAIEFSKALE